MDEPKPRRRLLSLLRVTARAAQQGMGAVGAAPRNAQEETTLWLLHGRAGARARDVGESAQRLSTGVARQRGAIDGATERTRVVASRGQEVASGFTRVVDAFERLSLVALNAGLEGARIGEGPGRALLLVADEIRGHAARGAETARELSTSLAELGAEWNQVSTQLGLARDLSAELAQEAARTAGAAAEVDRALGEMSERIRRTTGSDPETARAVAEVAEHARSLVAALGTLGGRVPPSLLAGALRPVLESLATVLDGSDEESEPPPAGPPDP